MKFSCSILFLCVCVIGAVAARHHGHKGKTHKHHEKCTTEFKGCRLMEGKCDCGTVTGCTDPYPYVNEHQCEKDLRGELDKCRKEPCEHGQCVQVKTVERYRTWECSCSGSGYHGRRCQHECPRLENGAPVPNDYPTDCVY